MKKLSILLLTVLTLGVFGTSCTTNDDGKIVQQSISVDDFTGVEAAGSFDVEVTVGDTKSVVAEGQQHIIDRLKTEVQSDGTLLITLENGIYTNFTLKVFVTVPMADKFIITGSGDMDVFQTNEAEINFTGFENLTLDVTGSGDLRGHGNFKVNNLTKATISGSGDIDFNVNTKTIQSHIVGSGNLNMQLTTEQADSKITGSGCLNFQGSSPQHKLEVIGSGNLHGLDFNTQTAEIIITGSGDAECWVENTLDVVISGSGDVHYKGKPAINADISGTGNISPAN